jgi:opacity protein-like surface antigen
MKIHKNLSLTLILSTVILTSVATAQDSGSYVSAYGGINLKPDSANSGELTSNFTTGAGTTIPAGTVLLSGTSLSWDTDFDTGYGLGFAYGYRVGNGLRPELEVRYSSNSVSGHANVAVGGAPIGTEDAGILVANSPNLGVSVADLVSDGQGDVDTWSFMGNVYYDIMPDEMFSPYVGFGIGYANTDLTFEPSAVSVADASDGGFAYQAIVGADLTVTQSLSVFADYRYFRMDDPRIGLSLLPGFLEIENETNLINFGVKFRF